MVDRTEFEQKVFDREISKRDSDLTCALLQNEQRLRARLKEKKLSKKAQMVHESTEFDQFDFATLKQQNKMKTDGQKIIKLSDDSLEQIEERLGDWHSVGRRWN